jgi:hypothetical protein
MAWAWSRMMPAVSAVAASAVDGLCASVSASPIRLVSGVRRSCESEAGIELRSRSAAIFAQLRDLGVMQPLEGDGDQGGRCFQQGTMAAQPYRVVGARGRGEDAADAIRGGGGGKGQEEDRDAGARQRVGLDDGIAFIGRKGEIQFERRQLPGTAGTQRGLRVPGLGDQQGGRQVEMFVKAADDFVHLLDVQGGAEFLRQLVKLPHVEFADLRLLGALGEPGNQVGGDQADGQHHGEGDQVLGIGDGEGKVGRNEEEVEQGDAEERRQHRRPASEADGNDEHGEQEQHVDVGDVEPFPQGQQHQRRGDAERSCQGIAPLLPAGGCLEVHRRRPVPSRYGSSVLQPA